MGTLRGLNRFRPMLNDPANPTPTALGKPRILVVEDDFLIRVTLVEMLLDEDFDVIEAETGDAALAMIDAKVALVVTDMQLPGRLDGRALIEQARQTRPDLPAIYTSGRPDHALRMGSRDRAINKPYDGLTIATAIRQLLAA